MSNLKQLNEYWKSLKEGTDVPHETSDEKEPKDESIEVDVVAVASTESAPTKNASLYGKTPDFILFKDKNSKEVKAVNRDMGSTQAIKDFTPSSAKMEVSNPVDREIGSKPAVDEYKVNKAKMDTEEPVPREMGSKAAPREYLKEYKSNISKILGTIKESIKIQFN